MKLEIFESDFCLDITLSPENIEELTKLLRFSKNAKQEKPTVYLSFQNTPYLNINLKKVSKKIQCNNIKPEHRNNK